MRSPIAAALALVLAAALPAAAQVPPAPPPAAPAAAPERGSPAAVDAMRQALRSDKRGVVEKNLQLTEKEAKKFWPIYDAFQADLERVQKRQNRAVLDYVNAESSMTDANAKRIAKEVAAADADDNKLREKYLKKLYAVLPARKAVRYMQIENKIRALNQYDLAAQIPLVR